MADIVYPLYVVIDASMSMNKETNGQRRIDLAREIPLALLRLYEEDNSLISSVQVSVITFNTEAKCLMELGEIPKIRSLPLAFEAKSKTFYGVAFQKTFERINADFEKLSKTTKFMKPAVVFVTDGRPNDDPGERNSAFRRLVPVDKVSNNPDLSKFANSPQVIMLGIDVANEKILEAYASHPNFARKASDSLAIDEQLKLIARWVKDAVSSSLAKPQMNPDEPWLDWVSDDDDDDEIIWS